MVRREDRPVYVLERKRERRAGDAKPPLVLTCACCGGLAPAFAQWHNQDLGYGLCGRCAAWISGRVRHFNRRHFRRTYGKRGVHWIPEPAVIAPPEGNTAAREQS